jgi:hypothetical protein
MPKVTDDAYTPLWKDRKRILGMPLSFTRYEVTKDRFITHKGLFSTETNELLLYRILDIKLVRKFGQKIFGVGTITLYSADQSHETLEIKNIKKPDAVRRFLSKIIEQERTSKGITGRELYGAAGVMAAADNGSSFDFSDSDGDGIPG